MFYFQVSPRRTSTKILLLFIPLCQRTKIRTRPKTVSTTRSTTTWKDYPQNTKLAKKKQNNQELEKEDLEAQW